MREYLLDTGLVEGMPAPQYHSIDAVNASSLTKLRKSPAHLRHELDNPAEPSKAMALGSLVHCLVLEPQAFDRQFAVAPDVDGRSKAGKEAREMFLMGLRGRTAVSREELEQARACAAAVRAHPLAAALLDHADKRELTGVWKDAGTGLLCKFRADAVAAGIKTAFDLKTTRDASRREFERSIFNFRYYGQGAWYREGLRALGVEIDHYSIIAVETEAPFGVSVYRLEDECLEMGDVENHELLRFYAQCRKTGKWPGYPEKVQTISIPTWALKQLGEEYGN